MMNAYKELYLDDAMCNLGEMCDYAINDCKIEPQMFFDVFVASPICRQMEIGNPKYIAGKSGVELAREIWKQMTGEDLEQDPSYLLERSPEYWAGWSMAYYQWLRNIKFQDFAKYDLSLPRIRSMYILHEADITKFVQVIDQIMIERKEKSPALMKRLRKYYGLTQKELSDQSGVTLRMIQLYEQGQNDLAKAHASVVMEIAQVLGCLVEDMIA